MNLYLTGCLCLGVEHSKVGKRQHLFDGKGEFVSVLIWKLELKEIAGLKNWDYILVMAVICFNCTDISFFQSCNAAMFWSIKWAH